jgi:uncharacterized cupin superfamily protein
MSTAKHIVRAAARTPESAEADSHPLNERSRVVGHGLARPAGLKAIGLWELTIPPGKESFVYHRHHREEEFIYVLAGRGIVEIEDEEHEVGPGDFVGFPPGTAHHLRNPYDLDLRYLSGGQNLESEVADFPRHDRRMVRIGPNGAMYAISAAQELPWLKKL